MKQGNLDPGHLLRKFRDDDTQVGDWGPDVGVSGRLVPTFCPQRRSSPRKRGSGEEKLRGIPACAGMSGRCEEPMKA